MKSLLLTTLITVTTLLSSVVLPASADTLLRPSEKLQTPRIKIPIVVKPIKCPNPAAHRIDFKIVRRTSQFRGRVRITGVVKNVGLANYESRPNQQGIYLYQGSKLVAKRNFQNLTPGQEVKISYYRNWNASSPSEGEFPPSYTLRILYDPDITLDSNPNNDDCNGGNNQKTRSGSSINDLFR
ncbi:MAG: hypothetical protein QNJ47_26615 [Nostocaceae cyanobacterium]|nr:hypothetical protein [Nostocaceae cyanobacterium]